EAAMLGTEAIFVEAPRSFAITRIYAYLGELPATSRRKQHGAEARNFLDRASRMSLPCHAPGGAPRDPLLRSRPCPLRLAHAPVFRPGQSAPLGTYADQSPRGSPGLGPHHVGAQYRALAARRANCGFSERRRSAQQRGSRDASRRGETESGGAAMVRGASSL